MAYYGTCPYCGANNDLGERCDCGYKSTYRTKEQESWRTGRAVQTGSELWQELIRYGKVKYDHNSSNEDGTYRFRKIVYKGEVYYLYMHNGRALVLQERQIKSKMKKNWI